VGREELLDEAGLPGPGGSKDGEELAGAVRGGPRVRALEERSLRAPADHRGIEPPGPHRGERGDLQGPVRGNGLGLAPQGQRLDRLGDDRVADQAVRRFTKEDLPAPGCRLEARRRVHGVPDERRPVAGDEDLARGDPDPDRDRKG
jgi:hypothetical protein